MLVWHSSDDADKFAENFENGGFAPGKKYGAMYGPGLYTNISPCQAKKCSYGIYIHVFSVKLDDKFRDLTLIGDVAFYKFMYKVDKLPEDWFIGQIRRRCDAAGVDLPVEAMSLFTKFNEEGLKYENDAANFHSCCDRTADWYSANYGVVRSLGFANIVYFGWSDHLCLVMYRPLLFAKYEGIFIAENLHSESGSLTSGGRGSKNDETVDADYKFFADRPEKSKQDRLNARKLEAVLLGFNGSATKRLQKMLTKISPEDAESLRRHIEEKFIDSQWTAWRPKLLQQFK